MTMIASISDRRGQSSGLFQSSRSRLFQSGSRMSTKIADSGPRLSGFGASRHALAFFSFIEVTLDPGTHAITPTASSTISQIVRSCDMAVADGMALAFCVRVGLTKISRLN